MTTKNIISEIKEGDTIELNYGVMHGSETGTASLLKNTRFGYILIVEVENETGEIEERFISSVYNKENHNAIGAYKI